MANVPSSADNLDLENQSLSSIFQEGLDLYNNLGKIDEPTNSPSVQANIKKAIHLFENATRLVSLTGLFSTNESIEEVATEDLRFLLLPALLGALCLKITSRDRKDITNVSEIYYKDFLQRCNDYGLSNYKFHDEKPSDANTQKTDLEEITVAINSRAGKIQRFKEQKELKAKLEQLKCNMENENADDEIKRNYFLTMIKLFIYEAIDELSSILSEKQILEHMAQINKDVQIKPKRPPPPPLKPVIITRDEVQKAVFGAGYPALPVMSVQEFYEKRVQDGIFPNPNATNKPLCLQDATPEDISLRDTQEEEEKEKKQEEDDPDFLQHMRETDEFKDDHRRGWGNRMNRS
ncbi:hypothetical protein RN001_007903 [Aquatica leii]|uniref:Immunoglobulin-binding protein 1 n=1 Tax=Aquatica leii TaxID=1421715 RepID=A0AAN7PYM3_9COLE|nr:hypothetical protein RN001_007903 [Aquatica leii]